MKSMTGFGQAKASTKTAEFEVSIRAINGRFLELRFHSPRELLPLESELRKTLEKNMVRGTVDIFVSRREVKQKVRPRVEIHEHLVQEYGKALHKIEKLLGSKGDHRWAELVARLPEVLTVSSETGVIEKSDLKLFQATFEKAVKNCDAERVREGKSLALELQKQIGLLGKLVDEIESQRKEANLSLQARLEQRLHQKLAQLGGEAPGLDPQRLSQEFAVLLEKSDINEEVVRLREHLENFGSLLKLKEPLGKKLDFYTQELLREVNTIGSKSSVSKLTQSVVEAKTVIERLREQVQNVE